VQLPGRGPAGTSRLRYPSSLRIVRVPCSGRVDPLFVLKAFQQGADGVMVLGCHPGDCHYHEGNYHARRRYAVMQRLLEYMGIERERFLVEWVSAAEGRRFADMAAQFAHQVGQLGPRREGQVDH
jgi:F420-non-reducing hydrogenase iron-sulfur subunit